MGYREAFGPIIANIDAELRAIRQEQTVIAPILWQIIDYQFGWDLEDDAQARRVSGKKIRPLLMALIAQAISGGYRHVLPAGAALEMIHNFTLIHDDVMDNSPERRHRPTVWTRWGKAQAINAGDGLFSLANLATTRLLEAGTPPAKVVQVSRVLAQACVWMCEGQILDIDFEERAQVSPDEYITMITNKSATLIEAAAKIGALLSTDDPAVVEAYGSFARNLGVAFQIRDDYLGVWGDQATTGKSATSDIREKKKSYPVLVTFARAAPQDREQLQRLYAQDALTEADIEAVLAILGRVDAATHTDTIARQYYDTALDSLDCTGISNDTQDLIQEYAAFLIRRAY
jgi:geranylgeranyl diphosphate synthase, type I